MELTGDAFDIVVGRLRADPGFRHAYLKQVVDLFLEEDMETGKAMLRRYVNGTVGFPALGAALGLSPKSLMRMLGAGGNPQSKNLFAILGHLQRAEGVRAKTTLVRRKDAA